MRLIKISSNAFGALLKHFLWKLGHFDTFFESFQAFFALSLEQIEALDDRVNELLAENNELQKQFQDLEQQVKRLRSDLEAEKRRHTWPSDLFPSIDKWYPPQYPIQPLPNPLMPQWVPPMQIWAELGPSGYTNGTLTHEISKKEQE